MGLTLAFYAGSSKEIIQAFDEVDSNPEAVFEYLDSFQSGVNYADFALHITPNDLNLLTAELCKMLGEGIVSLREYLDFKTNYVDEPDRGAYLVSEEWVNLWSRVDVSQARKLTENWFMSMQKEYGDPEIVITDEALKAVSDLIAVCKNVESESLDLVHTWFG